MMRKITRYLSLNGKLIDRDEAVIPVFERGYLYGEGVFTTLKVRSGIPLFLERHMVRLSSNAGEIGISFNQKIEDSVGDIIRKNKLENGGVRITVTGGNSLSDRKSSTVLVQGFEIESKVEEVGVITVSDYRDIYKSIKTTYRIPHIFAQKKAEEKGCQDALFSFNGRLIESTYANIFARKRDGEIVTPPIAGRGLNGITRQILMENLKAREEDLLAGYEDPLVLVSSLSLRSVKSINGRKIKRDAQFVSLIRQAVEEAEVDYMGKSRNK